MPANKAKSWACEICQETVSELGSYIKLALNRYAHGGCFYNKAREEGIGIGRQEIIDKIAKGAAEKIERDAKEHEERVAREKAEAERRAEVAERERTNRILAAQKQPMPPLFQPQTTIVVGPTQPTRPAATPEIREPEAQGKLIRPIDLD